MAQETLRDVAKKDWGPEKGKSGDSLSELTLGTRLNIQDALIKQNELLEKQNELMERQIQAINKQTEVFDKYFTEILLREFQGN